MIKCIFGFVRAFLRIQWAKVRGYEVLADPIVSGQRWLRCQHCPFFDGAQCEVCCCLAEAKAMIAIEKCPKGYWNAIWQKKDID